ncbi:hypothetical protein ATANTOWER_032597 [Ataeniobius toweri]|uniref:Immunoglobulin domain-containing protein n=1 Tax=Ataeniobius toweri TaxID=208326 RepID=A0ABU7C582_9TELE|nr:hypothetical protein [Ataeniobius toweri]
MSILRFMMTLSLALVSGSSLNDQVHQTPFYIQAKPGETARINCSHSIQNYDVILWYKRSEDRQLQLLGYMYLDNKYPEPGVNVEMDGNAAKDQNCTLIIKGLSVSSSAVYFCAASYHSAAYYCSSVHKPPHHCFCNLYLSSHPAAPV